MRFQAWFRWQKSGKGPRWTARKSLRSDSSYRLTAKQADPSRPNSCAIWPNRVGYRRRIKSEGNQATSGSRRTRSKGCLTRSGSNRGNPLWIPNRRALLGDLAHHKRRSPPRRKAVLVWESPHCAWACWPSVCVGSLSSASPWLGSGSYWDSSGCLFPWLATALGSASQSPDRHWAPSRSCRAFSFSFLWPAREVASR